MTRKKPIRFRYIWIFSKESKHLHISHWIEHQMPIHSPDNSLNSSRESKWFEKGATVKPISLVIFQNKIQKTLMGSFFFEYEENRFSQTYHCWVCTRTSLYTYLSNHYNFNYFVIYFCFVFALLLPHSVKKKKQSRTAAAKKQKLKCVWLRETRTSNWNVPYSFHIFLFFVLAGSFSAPGVSPI